MPIPLPTSFTGTSINLKIIWPERRFANLRVACRCGEKAVESSPSDTQTPLVVQENHYDPFGLDLTGLNLQPGLTASRFKYIDRELQADLGWYDLQARFYDPGNGRFTTVDQLAENGRHWSPYVYGLDNPLRFIDSDGLWPFPSWRQLANQAKNYVVHKAVETISNVVLSTVNYAKREVNEVLRNTEVAVYGKAEVKLTVSAGGAAEVKGVGVDARYRHIELLSGGVELDTKKGGSINGNYISKNGERKEVSTASAGFIIEGGYSREVTTTRNGIVATRSEIDAGGVYGAIPIPIAILPLGGGIKLSKETTTGNTYETRVEAARTGVKIGIPFTFSFDTSIGIRATYTKKDEQ